jgi:hypothetical protein
MGEKSEHSSTVVHTAGRQEGPVAQVYTRNAAADNPSILKFQA